MTCIDLVIRTHQDPVRNLNYDSVLCPGGPLSFRHPSDASAAKNRSSVRPQSIHERFKTGIGKKRSGVSGDPSKSRHSVENPLRVSIGISPDFRPIRRGHHRPMDFRYKQGTKKGNLECA